ncbi:MAG: hypothetical protein JWN14_62 [Chthonomonadales bacterium]|nr:hypothetical protein [Chthonomonadales bacterium]
MIFNPAVSSLSFHRISWMGIKRIFEIQEDDQIDNRVNRLIVKIVVQDIKVRDRQNHS